MGYKQVTTGQVTLSQPNTLTTIFEVSQLKDDALAFFWLDISSLPDGNILECQVQVAYPWRDYTTSDKFRVKKNPYINDIYYPGVFLYKSASLRLQCKCDTVATINYVLIVYLADYNISELIRRRFA